MDSRKDLLEMKGIKVIDVNQESGILTIQAELFYYANLFYKKLQTSDTYELLYLKGKINKERINTNSSFLHQFYIFYIHIK